MPINEVSEGGGGGVGSGTYPVLGFIDASLAANLPVGPSDGDTYRVSVAGDFQNDASIFPASYAFTIGDKIQWDDTNSRWQAMESGDDVSKKVVQVNTAIDYNVIDDGLDYEIYCDTTTIPVTVTLTGTSSRSIKVIDAGENAGANIITIAGTIDGATNATIEADGGSKEVTYSGSAWESSGGFDNFFERVGATGLIKTKSPDKLSADVMQAGDSGTTYTGLPANFEQAEANVDQQAGWWGNAKLDGSDIANGKTVTSNYALSSGVLSNLTDGNSGTSVRWDNRANPHEVVIDMVASAPYSKSTIVAPSTGVNNPGVLVEILGSPDDISYTSIWTGSEVLGNPGSISVETGNVTSYRYIKHRFNRVTSALWLSDIEIYDQTYATTTNTFQHRPLSSGSSTTFTPITFTPKDETGSPLVNGDLLIEYSLDDGATWPGGQRSLTDFKALGNLTGTSFWLRYEMVGAKKLGSASITTASTFGEMTGSGMNLTAEGSMAGQYLLNYPVNHTLTGVSPSQALDMATYNNFIVDMNDCTTSATLTFTTPVQGQTYTIKVIQTNAAVANIDITWPTTVGAGGATPTAITTTDDAEDIFQFFYDGTNMILMNEKQNLS